MALLDYQFAYRTIRRLGSNDYVDLGTIGLYRLLTTGTIDNRAAEGQTVVAYVSIAPNSTLATWAAVTTTFLINSPAWEAQTLTLSNFPDVPAIVFGAGRAIPNKLDFIFQVVAGNAVNYIATVTAFGWTI